MLKLSPIILTLVHFDCKNFSVFFKTLMESRVLLANRLENLLIFTFFKVPALKVPALQGLALLQEVILGLQKWPIRVGP